MNSTTTRRSFIGTAAAGGASLAASLAGEAAEIRPTADLIRVGMVALGTNSHYYIWSPTINPVDHDAWPVGRTTGMQITHCWDKDSENAKTFAERYGCEAVDHYYDMVGKVDAMIFAGFREVYWWPKLTKPYLEAGIPCFINRPFAYSMRDARYMVDIARSHNTPILCTDEREYIKEAIAARCKVRELLNAKKTIICADSDNAATEYPQHGIHGLYFLLAIFGIDVERVSYQADGWWREVTPTATKQNWGQLALQYRTITIDDAPVQTRPIIVAQQQMGSHRSNAGIRIFSSDEDCWQASNIHVGEERMNRLYYLFFPTVLAMQRMFATRLMQWSYDYILKKTQIYLTGFKSHLEHDGAMVEVDNLPDDWTAPNPYPDWIDEGIFG